MSGAPGPARAAEVGELRLWLIGRGIGASPSPAMQEAALRARGLRGSYRLRDVEPAELPAVLAALREGAAEGANVTIPYKLEVARACDALEGDAELTGSVNTVVAAAGRLVGVNTDAAGLEQALRAAGLLPVHGHAVVAGAGGAAAAAVLALSRGGAARSTVLARRPQAAADLRARLSGVAEVDAAGWEGAVAGAALAEATLVVNATPCGLDALPFHPRDLPDGCAVVDLRYRPRPVDLVAAALESGHRACDGLEMLLRQGMLSFRRWTGLEPPLEAARAALHRAVGA